MRYIKTYEASANPYRNEKLKENKSKVAKISLSEKVIKPLIMSVFEDEQYKSFCEDNIIDPIDFNVKMATSFSLKDDKYTHSLNKTFFSHDKLYKNNYLGMCKILNDYYQEDPVAIEDDLDNTKNGTIVSRVYSIRQRLTFMLNVSENSCAVYIYYELEWGGMTFKASIDNDNGRINRKENITRNDVLNLVNQNIEEFRKEFKKIITFQKKIKEKVKEIKSLVKTFATSSLGHGSTISHFPFLIHLLDLDEEELKGSKDLKGMGFDD